MTGQSNPPTTGRELDAPASAAGGNGEENLPATQDRTPLASEQVVISAPMSFTGSAQRIWRATRPGTTQAPWLGIVLNTLVVLLIGLVWCIVLVWYLFFGIFLIPYRILRRGARKRHREALQHQELLAALERTKGPQP